jgi:predicted AAA+ superfamily ATPase
LARNQARSEILMQDPAGNYRNRRLAVDDPSALLSGAQPVLIDEWQDAPPIWDAVRMEVDRSGEAGQFILTASTTPRDSVTAHTGTGRMSRLHLWPMSSAETGFSTGVVSLGSLLDGSPPLAAIGAASEASLLAAITGGGWPASVDRSYESAFALPQHYLDALVHSDASRLDGVRRDPDKLSALIASLARNTSTVVTNATLAQDMAQFEGMTPAPNTIAEYLDVLRRLHVLIHIPAWSPALRSPVRLREAPKRILVDPSLAVAALHADVDSLTSEPKTTGLLFENLCLRDLAVYSAANDAQLSHYRDNSGLEVDAIIAKPGRFWAGVEIKWSITQVDKAAASLIRLRDKMTNNSEQAPRFLAVLVGTGDYAHTRPDGVLVLPIDTLGP